MNFRLAALVDRFIGRLLLQMVVLLPPQPKRIPRNIGFRNILIIKFWGFGSILEATPLFRTLKEKYPDAKIDILTFSANKKIVWGLGLFRKVYVLNLKRGIFNFSWQTIRFIIRHRKQYSLVIDLEFFAHFSAVVTKMLGSSYSLGFRTFFALRNRCYSQTVVFDHSNHVRLIFLKFLDALYVKEPLDVSLSSPQIPPAKKISVTKKIPALDKDGMHIAVNINSSDLFSNRSWPEDNFRKLIGFIQQDNQNLQIYLVGGREDASVVESFYESLPHKRGVHMLAGKLDILEFTYALSKMTCLITSDSGPLHIAEALGVPVVSFFGPETPNLYGPLSERSMSFYNNLFCSPCLNVYNHKRSECQDNQCLKLISPEEVYEKVKKAYFGQQPLI